VNPINFIFVNRKVLNKPHKKLDVWKKAIDLVQQIYDLTKTFPKNEDYSLTTA